MLTRERKDPEQPLNFVPICENCNSAYVTKQVLHPFIKNCEKLRTLSAQKEKDYYLLGEGFNRVYGDIQNKNKVIIEKTEYSE